LAEAAVGEVATELETVIRELVAEEQMRNQELLLAQDK
jgi:hypothetical protein